MSIISTLIFDLSEVLIAGLIGIERPLAEKLRIPEEVVLSAFGGKQLEDLCRGEISEKRYLTTIVEQQQWDIPIHTLKILIRENLKRRVPGMIEVLKQLKPHCQLVLLSDNAQNGSTTFAPSTRFLKRSMHRSSPSRLAKSRRNPPLSTRS